MAKIEKVFHWLNYQN